MDVDTFDINAIPEERGEFPECRICGGGAEDNAPLFYPCKCSGSIRYIHQACLTTWLKHRKNTSCDICKHPYAFTKVYTADMPKRIPIFVFFKQVILQVFATFAVGLRAWLVVAAWLIVVPYTTVWVWRFYFWSGDQIAWNVYGPLEQDEPTIGRPNSTDTLLEVWNFFSSTAENINHTVFSISAIFNATAYVHDHPNDTDAKAHLDFLLETYKPNFLNDIITGQIITAMLVVIFLAVFLLREWVVQNAAPGLLGEDDVLGEVEGEPIEVADNVEEDMDAGFGLGHVARGAVVAVPQPALPGQHAEEHGPDRHHPDGLNDPVMLDRRPDDPAEPTAIVDILGALQSQDVLPSGRQEPWDMPREPLPPGAVRFYGSPDWTGPVTDFKYIGIAPIVSPDTPSTLRATSLATESAPEEETIPQTKPASPLWKDAPFTFTAPRQVPSALDESSSSGAGPSGLPHTFDPAPPPIQDSLPFRFNLAPQVKDPHSTSKSDTKPVPGDPVLTAFLDAFKKDGPAGDRPQRPSEPAGITNYEESIDDTPLDEARGKRRKGSSLEHMPTSSDSPFIPNPDSTIAHASLTNGSARSSRVPSSASQAKPGPSPKSNGSTQHDSGGRKANAPTDRKGKGRATDFASEDFAFTFTTPRPETSDPSQLAPADAPRTFSFSPAFTPSPLETDNKEDHAANGPDTNGSGEAESSADGAPSLALTPSSTEKTWSKGIPSDFQFSFSFQAPQSDVVVTDPPDPASTRPSLPPMGKPRFVVHEAPLITTRRPQLPPTTPIGELPSPAIRPPLVEPAAAQAIPSRIWSNGGTPSPHLATYQAPEQLDSYFPIREEPAPEPVPEVFADPASPVAPGAFPNPIPVDDPAEEDIVQEPNPPRPEVEEQPLEFDDDDLLDPMLLDEDVDPDAMDEVEGAMEAVGMRGPLIVLFQNVLLVMVLLYFTMAIVLWLPYIVGKTAALITLRPIRGLYLVDLPLRLVRVFTDPLIDLVLRPFRGVGGSAAGPKSTGSIVPIAHKVSSVVARLSSELVTSYRNDRLRSDEVVERFSNRLHLSVESLLGSPYTNLACSALAFNAMAKAHIREIWGQLKSHARAGLVAALPRLRAWAAGWVLLARGNGPEERAFAVGFGYFITICTLGTTLEWAGPNLGTTARFMRSAIRQQVIVMKVAVFIIIELVVFPLGCGVLFDFNTLPLFPSGTLGARLAFLRYSPITSIFLHWMLGTMFMYQFAVLLSSCRSIMRPGAMWFIKDPADPNFHPIRDILDRPVIAQFRKLFTSAMMYAGVLTFGIRGILFLVASLPRYPSPFLPLRTSMLNPLSEIPIDLLFLHIIVPTTLSSLKPRAWIGSHLNICWKKAAETLRLTSYIFGGRIPEEEQFDPRNLVTRLWDWVARKPFPAPVRSGTLVRAPALDSLILPSGKRALIEVDEEGEPVGSDGAELKRLQDEACTRIGLDPSTAFTVVFIPPSFKLRVIAFALTIWFASLQIALACFAAPIYVGRICIHLAGHSPVHDGYTWSIGFYVLLGMGLLYKEAKRLQRKRPTPQRFAKKVCIKAPQVIYMAFMIGIVMPVLVSLAVDTLLIIPTRIWLGYTAKPEIHIVESWACGLILIKIGIKASRMDPRNPLYMTFLRIVAEGYRNPDAWRTTEEFILPICAPLLAMIFVPFLFVKYIQTYVFPGWKDEQAALRWVAPSLFVISSVIAASRGIYRTFRRWTQTIRDARYLVELRLTNLDDPRDTPPLPVTPTHS